MATIHSLHAKPLMSHTATGRPDVERQLFYSLPPYICLFCFFFTATTGLNLSNLF